MKKSYMILSLLLFGVPNVHAANFAVITQPPTMLSAVVFLVGVGCLVGTLKVLSLLKGGLLFKSWQIFMAAFIVLVLSQATNLINDFELFLMPTFAVPALLLLALGLFLYGVFETKKTLE